MAAIDKVRVIVAGDSGVGKTSLTHLISQGEPLTSPGWTIGCSVEVKLHEYKEGTQAQRTFFIELWDIGGSVSHQNTRGVFYQPTHGIILVHDLTNRKSQQNLQKWLTEILNKDGNLGKNTQDDFFDPENFVGSTQIPILVIGTKLDLAQEKQNLNRRNHSDIAEQCGAVEIHLSCHQSKSLAAGTTSAVKLCKFFDKGLLAGMHSFHPLGSGSLVNVIERRWYNHEASKGRRVFQGNTGNLASPPMTNMNPYSSTVSYNSPLLSPQGYDNPLTPKFYHMD